MERLFSPCTRPRDLVEIQIQVPTKWLRELDLDVSTDGYLSTERGFTYAALIHSGLRTSPRYVSIKLTLSDPTPFPGRGPAFPNVGGFGTPYGPTVQRAGGPGGPVHLWYSICRCGGCGEMPLSRFKKDMAPSIYVF
jgi:hypothetical protein